MNNRVITLGSLELRPPEVIAVVDRVFSVQQIRKLGESKLRILEFRFDSFAEPFDSVMAYLSEVKKTTGFAILGTLRENKFNKDKRASLYQKFVPLVDCVDIEVETEKTDRQAFIKIVRDADKQLMISHHDFRETVADLDDVMRQCLELKPDFVKIATMANTREDAARLMKFQGEQSEGNTPLTTIGMGEQGALTRIAAGLFGSTFAYGFIEEANAPGQLSALELAENFRRFYK